VRPPLIGLGVLVLASGGSRAVFRMRRLRRVRRWEIRLGREDLATPYQREKMFDSFYGQLGERWWRRLATGQPSIALEVHNLPDGTQRLTLAANEGQAKMIEGRLLATYPEVRLVPGSIALAASRHVIRLKKRHTFVARIQTVKDDEQALVESVVATMARTGELATVQLVITPAPWAAHWLSRRLLKSRERGLTRAERRDPADIGVDSVIEDKELKGALETQHRSLFWTDLRVSSQSYKGTKALAGLFAESRSENVLVSRHAVVRAWLYSKRTALAAANPLPSFLHGVLSSSELAALWSLPRQRVKAANLPRSAVRPATAPPEITRDPRLEIMRDERGPVGILPEDFKYGRSFVGGQGVGKTSGTARTIEIDAQDREAAMITLDPNQDLARHALRLIPEDRVVWYMDLASPEVGINPLRIAAEPSAVADVVLQAMKEVHEPGAILSQSDEFLRNAALAVCAAESEPTLWHMYELLSPRRTEYREKVVDRLERLEGMGAVARYWGHTFPERWMDSRTHMAGQLAAPLNKINRLLTTPSVDIALRHPFSLDIGGIIRRREILIVNGALGAVGEENAVVVLQMLLQLIHQAMKQQQRLPPSERTRVCLKIDEAHLVLTPSFARMLALHRAAGPLEVTAAWQYSAQVQDLAVRSGLKSLLRSRSMFAMGEVAEAREQAEVAMELYSDTIRTEREDRERMRFGPDDIVRLPTFTAINSWVANGARQAAFVAETLPMEDRGTDDRREHHLSRQRAAGAVWPEKLAPPIEIPAAGERIRRERVEGKGNRDDDSRAPAKESVGQRDVSVSADSRPEPEQIVAEGLVRPLGEETAAGDAVPDAVEQPALFGPVPSSYEAVHRPGMLGLVWSNSKRDPALAKRFEPQARDLEIVRALWRYEVLLLSQIWREWWPDRTLRSAQMRLKRLALLGWLRRFRPRMASGTHESGYMLEREGFLAGQRHEGVDGTYIPRDAKWRRRRIVDHRSILHMLQVNAWAIAYKGLTGDYVTDWRGEHEGRLEVPTKLMDGRRVPIEASDVPRENYERVRDLRGGGFGRIWPDATLTVDIPDQGRRFDLMLELDRTDRPAKNFDKFERYDALISAWWRKVPRYAEAGEPPGAIFICSDEEHVFRFMQAADRRITARLAQPGVSEASWPYPGRERILFVAERAIHEGSGRAWKLAVEPPSTRKSLESREVQLPGLSTS
jgi:protein involved in plasmid replication-relaxation